MKIVMLNGQNHKGSSYRIGKMIAEKIQGENEVREFFFPRDLNHFCTGCYQCIENLESCPFYFEKKVILDAVHQADILIVTTPTYCRQMSASLKAFFDLNFDGWMVHRPMSSMFTKKAVILSTSAGSSPKAAMRGVQNALRNMGVPEITRLGMRVQAMNWEGVSAKKKAALEKKTAAIARKLSKGKKPAVGWKTRFLFWSMGMLHRKGWNSSPTETAYWKERGWLDGKKPWKLGQR
ncbi:MAG: NAD(P)H-dependent oxidoreductase [Oscillospiraceae bacterium]|nr:NAD(P)H-dependent oxidoreductase [Oscillospiraceae bacterium]